MFGGCFLSCPRSINDLYGNGLGYWMKRSHLVTLCKPDHPETVNFIEVALLVLTGRYSVGVASLTHVDFRISENEYFSKEVTIHWEYV